RLEPMACDESKAGATEHRTCPFDRSAVGVTTGAVYQQDRKPGVDAEQRCFDRIGQCRFDDVLDSRELDSVHLVQGLIERTADRQLNSQIRERSREVGYFVGDRLVR